MKYELFDSFEKLPAFAQNAVKLGDQKLPMIIWRQSDSKLLLLAIIQNMASFPFILVELT